MARNMQSVPFPDSMGESDIEFISNAVDNFANNSKFSDHICVINLNQIKNNEKRLLRERNIITHEMEISEHSLVLIDSINDFAILINEEDHFRIQVIRPGLQLMEVYMAADKIDDELNKYVPYSFSEELGFLSACTSNLGTGLRISVLLHLPVLTKKNLIPQITEELKNRGIEIKGTIANSDKTLGAMYQISNKISLGISEIDIIEQIDGIVNDIMTREDQSRDEYLSQSKVEIEDMIWRSYGVLQHSRRISYIEAMEHLSNLRLGVVLAIVKNIDISDVNNLMVNIQWAHLQWSADRFFRSTVECDEYRAGYIRNFLI